MIVKSLLTDTNIIDCLQLEYGIQVHSLAMLALGADMNASVYKMETQQNKTFFIKLKNGYYNERGIPIMELFHFAGMQQLIFPIKTLQGESIAQGSNFSLIVYPFVEGDNGFDRPLTDAQWLKLGRTLRQVHQLDVPASIQRQIRYEDYSPKWREMVRAFYSHIKVKSGVDEIAQKLSAFMTENKELIHQLVNRAEVLAQKIQTETPKFVLCHSDIHGGNVLLQGDDALYIVDWDEPMMAPKERDLMFIGAGVGNVWNKEHEIELFYKGYGETEINTTLLAYYRHERIVQDIAEYGEALLLTNAGAKDRAEMYQHFLAMFKPNGVVEVALKSDEKL